MRSLGCSASWGFVLPVNLFQTSDAIRWSCGIPPGGCGNALPASLCFDSLLKEDQPNCDLSSLENAPKSV